jgi:hypothetical protein
VVEAEGKKPRYRVVKSKPYQLKRGSELKFKSFDLCPYRYYGKLEAFHKPLCHHWERKATKKVQKVSFKRGLRTLPAVHAQALQAQQSHGGVVGISGPKGNVLIVGARELTPEKLQQIYDRITDLQLDAHIEGQQAEVIKEALRRVLLRLGVSMTVVGMAVAAVFDLFSIIQRLGSQASKLGDGFVKAAINTSTLGAIESNLRDYYDRWKAGTIREDSPEAAVGEFIDMFKDFLIAHGFAQPESADKVAINMLATFIHTFTQKGLNLTMKLLVERFGPLAPFIFHQLKEVDESLMATWVYAFPSNKPCATREPPIQDPIMCFLWQIDLLSSDVEGMNQLMAYLAAMAYVANNPKAEGDLEKGLEGIARVTLLVEEFLPRLRNNGWFNLRVQVGTDLCQDICFFGEKALYGSTEHGCIVPPDSEGCYRGLRIVGFIEPFLEGNDQGRAVDRVWRQIQNVAKGFPLPGWGSPISSRNVVVQILNGYDPAARNSLCSLVKSASFKNTPIIVIGPNGRIECWSRNTNAEEALFICHQLGIPNCHIPGAKPTDSPPPDRPSPPVTIQVPMPPIDPALDPACGNKPSPPVTIQVPMPPIDPALDPACGNKKLCLI